MVIHELTLKGILSFGPDSPPLKMQGLNVLIGPNGSGKSNLVEAIGLLRSAATKLTTPMRVAAVLPNGYGKVRLRERLILGS